MIKKALIITWSGYQDQEVIYPYYRLLEEGFHVEMLSDVNVGEWFYGILGTKMKCTLNYKTLTPSDVDLYDFLLLPGGVKALEKLRQEKTILKFISNFVEGGKIVASTCHGAQLLISAKVTSGKTVSGYYSIEDDIVNSGATYSREPVVVSKNIVSSPHYNHMGVWMKTAIDLYYKNIDPNEC